MVELSSRAKEIIKNELKPSLEEDNLKEVLYMFSYWLSHYIHWEDVANIAAFLYEIGVPILEVVDEVPKDLFFCTGLENVHIPSNIRVINTNAFSYCSQLTDVTFEEGLEEIGSAAFNHCEKLDKIILPSTVNLVRNFAFGNIPSLDLTINSDVEFYIDAFKSSKVRLYVPKDILHDSHSQVYKFLAYEPRSIREVIPV